MIMKKLYWDLETEGLPVNVVEPLMPEFEAPGNIKDAAKIAAAIEDKKKDWLDKCALRGITGKILAVSYAWDDESPMMNTGNERELIWFILGILKDCAQNGHNAYAWNGSTFDLPFLCQRSAVHSINAYHHLMTYARGRFYFNQSFVDPRQVWSNYSPDFSNTSLRAVALALGIGEKPRDGGANFASLLRTDYAKAEEYALNDIRYMRGVVQRMGI